VVHDGARGPADQQAQPSFVGAPGGSAPGKHRDPTVKRAQHVNTSVVGAVPGGIGLLARWANPGAAEALARQCCRLPLALRVAAERAAARPAESLADLVAELDDQRRRLDVLDAGGDPATAVRAVFSWSYQHLDPATARAFRLTGLHPGPDVDRYAAAALTSGTAAQAGRLLDRLARAYLLPRRSWPVRDARPAVRLRPRAVPCP